MTRVKRDARARACANREHELALRLLLRNFILQHPRCDERHRSEMRRLERRIPGPAVV